MTVPITAKLSGVTDWGTSGLVDAVLSALGGAFVDAATAISTAAVAALTATTTVDLSAAWFRRNVAVIAAITLPMLVGLFVVQVATSVLRRDPGGLSRALLGVGKATIGSALALAVTQSALLATDQVCAEISGAAGTTIEAAALRFLTLTTLSGSHVGPVLQMLLGLLVTVGSMLLWAVLLFRKTALIVVAVFAPVAFAGSVTDATRAWTRRWVEAVAALVVCKAVIVVVFVVGASAFSQVGPTVPGPAPTGGSSPGFGQGLSDLLVGVLLLTMAVASPWVTWRFLHWAGVEAAAVLTTAVAASPIPATGRAVTQQARFTANWAVTQAAFSALGIGAAGRPGAAAGRRPPSPPTPPPGGGSGPTPPPAAPPSPQPPRGWTPPVTRVRGGQP